MSECCMNVAEEMDAKDEELRETIKTLWPIQGSAMALILVPPKEGSDTAATIAAAAAADDDDDDDDTDDEHHKKCCSIFCLLQLTKCQRNNYCEVRK